MNKSIASDYIKDFSEQHPEVGEVVRGATLSAEALQAFAELINGRVREIERTPKPTDKERSFVRSSADMLARNLLFTIQDHPGIVTRSVEARQGITTIFKAAYMSDLALKSGLSERFEHLDRLAPSSRELTRGLDAVVNIVQQTGTSPEQYDTHGVNLTDIISGSFQALGAITAENDGLEVSQYLEGNLQNVIAHYEQATPNQ